ncbi:hypothetical protein B7486_11720 [cyanobacterium TDX16]|nr:hypothetical protein B7486_11720 [cyanobacterium TDX16]
MGSVAAIIRVRLDLKKNAGSGPGGPKPARRDSECEWRIRTLVELRSGEIVVFLVEAVRAGVRTAAGAICEALTKLAHKTRKLAEQLLIDIDCAAARLEDAAHQSGGHHGRGEFHFL